MSTDEEMSRDNEEEEESDHREVNNTSSISEAWNKMSWVAQVDVSSEVRKKLFRSFKEHLSMLAKFDDLILENMFGEKYKTITIGCLAGLWKY